MSSPPPLISVVIPAYNRRDSVLQLLADIFRQEGVVFEVIMVDDCSPDDTAQAVAARFPAARVFRNGENGGPAVSRNRGVRAAHGEFIVGFDSDVTLPDPSLLRRVAETFRRFPRATGLAFRLLAPDGRTDDAPRWWHPLPLGRFATQRFETDYFSGTGYAFRREEMLAAGLFPEILYMHYEEVVLAYRILDTSGAILYCPDLTVLHHAHPVAQRSKIRVFYKPRNQILLTLTCYPWLRVITYLAPRLVYHLLQSILHQHIHEYCRALFSAWSLAPQCLAVRRPLKKSTQKRISAMRHHTNT